MEDILKKDQREFVERIRALLDDDTKWELGTGQWINYAELLIDIIDSVAARSKKS